MSKVLVTGALGAVGQPVCHELLTRGHHVRVLDRVPVATVAESLAALGVDPLALHALAREAVVADIADARAVLGAMSGMDTVIHLAAEPHDVDFPLLIGPNVVGLYNVMNAARESGVKRVVLTSSIQVLGRRASPEKPASVDEAHPGNHYALTKLWAEGMGAMYAHKFGMRVLVARLAWLVRNPTEARHMTEIKRPNLYLSPRDAGRFFAVAVETLAKMPDALDSSSPWFHVVYAASRGGEETFDMEPARRLIGFEAQDRWPEGLAFDFT